MTSIRIGPVCVGILAGAAVAVGADPVPSSASNGGPVVEVDEIVARYIPPDNGAGPLWCYGAPLVVRQGQDVYVSIMETGQGVPPLANTRWQLWHRDQDGWHLVQQEKAYREREPCPLAVFPDEQRLFLSVNPSTAPPGTRYGPAHPSLLEFKTPYVRTAPTQSEPVWAAGTHFTDHSYRGLAADSATHELLLLNIHAQRGCYFLSLRGPDGTWQEKGRLEFPIRACYPQVALRQHAAHVLAIGDIVEPVEEWRKLKQEVLKSDWDYVFRRLFYACTSDVRAKPFASPVEIDTVEKTGGHISNLDLYVDAAGAAHLLYLKQPFQHAFLRDKYFPGQPMSASLEHVAVKDGKVASRQTLADSSDGVSRIWPRFARFHVAGDGTLLVVMSATLPSSDGIQETATVVFPIPPGLVQPRFARIPFQKPFGMFFTNTVRGGSAPGDVLDLLGPGDDGPSLRYARVRLRG